MYLGDPQMFPVDYKLREQVWDWAYSLNIQLEYNGHDFNMDVWRVVDPKHCVLFALRWA